MRRKTAQLLLALTAVLVPWDFRAYGQGVGWGMTFSLGKYVNTNLATDPGVELHSLYGSVTVSDAAGNQFRSIVRELQLIEQFDPGSQTGLWLWAAAGALAFAGLVATVYLSFSRDSWDEREYTGVGAVFALAGVAFVVSRFFIYDFLLVSASEMPNWFSVPLGGVYVVVVGGIFVYWGHFSDV